MSAQPKKSDLSIIGSLFLYMCKELKIESSIEIGAHKAEFSNEFIKFGKKSIAFEASTSVFLKFKDYVDRRIDYRNVAISTSNEQLVFYEIIEAKDILAKNSSFKKRNANDLNAKEVFVNSSTLKAALEEFELSKPVAVWIDAEGASLDILISASNEINKIGIVLLEVETRMYWENQGLYNDVDNFLAKCGFQKFARDYEAPHQFNLIYFNPNSVKPQRLKRLSSSARRNFASDDLRFYRLE